MAEAFRLLVRTGAASTQTALMDNGRLLEFYQEEANAESLIGAIFLGRVERVLPDVKAAFVKLGLPQNGFLPLREGESFHRTLSDAPLMSGQDVLVQVKKDPKGAKGAFLTRDISLPGQYALLMPNNRFIGLSKRIAHAAEREAAKRLGEEIAGGRFGLIVRHAALFTSPDQVKAEVEALWERWEQIAQSAQYAKAPQLLHAEPSMLEVLIRDYGARHSIAVESNAARAKSLPDSIAWRTLTAIELEAAWRGARIEEQLGYALDRRVELPEGGSLVIDEREALQTIDVNSGRTVFARDGQSLAVMENLAAVPEIARQIRLRNLSGILLVDFIDMSTGEERAAVLKAMETCVSDDRVKTVIHGFTSLGLLEMTRKRTRDTLRDAFTVRCAACGETGRVRRL